MSPSVPTDARTKCGNVAESIQQFQRKGTRWVRLNVVDGTRRYHGCPPSPQPSAPGEGGNSDALGGEEERSMLRRGGSLGTRPSEFPLLGQRVRVRADIDILSPITERIRNRFF